MNLTKKSIQIKTNIQEAHSNYIIITTVSAKGISKKKPHRNAAFVKNLSIL